MSAVRRVQCPPVGEGARTVGRNISATTSARNVVTVSTVVRAASTALSSARVSCTSARSVRSSSGRRSSSASASSSACGRRLAPVGSVAERGATVSRECRDAASSASATASATSSGSRRYRAARRPDGPDPRSLSRPRRTSASRLGSERLTVPDAVDVGESSCCSARRVSARAGRGSSATSVHRDPVGQLTRPSGPTVELTWPRPASRVELVRAVATVGRRSCPRRRRRTPRSPAEPGPRTGPCRRAWRRNRTARLGGGG